MCFFFFKFFLHYYCIMLIILITCEISFKLQFMHLITTGKPAIIELILHFRPIMQFFTKFFIFNILLRNQDVFSFFGNYVRKQNICYASFEIKIYIKTFSAYLAMQKQFCKIWQSDCLSKKLVNIRDKNWKDFNFQTMIRNIIQ